MAKKTGETRVDPNAETKAEASTPMTVEEQIDALRRVAFTQHASIDALEEENEALKARIAKLEAHFG